MAMPPLQGFLVLHLMGLFTGGKYQVFCVTDVSLDMAPNSFDDQYNGCDGGPTQSDPVFEGKYAGIWQLSVSTWNEKKNSLKPSQKIDDIFAAAITAYSHSGNLYKDFNAAVREGGKSSYEYCDSFRFKRFHFLLTKALQTLKAQSSPCYTVYRGIKGIRFTVSDQNQPVRFGQFASSSMNRTVAEAFGNDTFFTIETCLGVNITGFSFFPEQKEVLIPPYETFRVADVRKERTGTYIELKANGKHSNFNCGSKSWNLRLAAEGDRMLGGQLPSKKTTLTCPGAAPGPLSPRVPTPFLLWGALLLSGALGSMWSL